MKADDLTTAPTGEIVLYEVKNKAIRIEARLAGDTVWLNRQQMTSLFGRDVKTIGKHIGNALSEELRDIPTVANFATVQFEGTRQVERQVVAWRYGKHFRRRQPWFV